MMRKFLPLIIMTLTLVLAGLTARAETTSAALARTIAVSGSGDVSLPPDMTQISLGVQTDAEVAADALDAASAAVLAILARLDVEGVDPADIQTGALRLHPRYSSSALGSGQRIVGYRVVNSVNVQVNDLNRLGPLISALVGDGANRLDRVTFGLQDPSAAIDEARRLAVADAGRRAALYAQAAGVRVGEVLSISEQGGANYRAMIAEPVMLEAMASAPSFDVPVAAGEIDLSATINMIFTIADKNQE